MKETKTSFRRPAQIAPASSSPVRQSISLLQTLLFGIQMFDRQWKLFSLHSVTQGNYKCKLQDDLVQQPHTVRELYTIQMYIHVTGDLPVHKEITKVVSVHLNKMNTWLSSL